VVVGEGGVARGEHGARNEIAPPAARRGGRRGRRRRGSTGITGARRRGEGSEEEGEEPIGAAPQSSSSAAKDHPIPAQNASEARGRRHDESEDLLPALVTGRQKKEIEDDLIRREHGKLPQAVFNCPKNLTTFRYLALATIYEQTSRNMRRVRRKTYDNVGWLERHMLTLEQRVLQLRESVVERRKEEKKTTGGQGSAAGYPYPVEGPPRRSLRGAREGYVHNYAAIS
jgi:hypothetical protein